MCMCMCMGIAVDLGLGRMEQRLEISPCSPHPLLQWTVPGFSKLQPGVMESAGFGPEAAWCVAGACAYWNI